MYFVCTTSCIISFTLFTQYIRDVECLLVQILYKRKGEQLKLASLPLPVVNKHKVRKEVIRFFLFIYFVFIFFEKLSISLLGKSRRNFTTKDCITLFFFITNSSIRQKFVFLEEEHSLTHTDEVYSASVN